MYLVRLDKMSSFFRSLSKYFPGKDVLEKFGPYAFLPLTLYG